MARGTLHDQVRRLRFEHGEMTQRELAARAGCARQTIMALERGRYVPSLVLALRIARASGRPVEEVFDLAD